MKKNNIFVLRRDHSLFKTFHTSGQEALVRIQLVSPFLFNFLKLCRYELQ